MKLNTIKDTMLDDDYVDVRYRELSPDIHEIIQICQKNPSILLCDKDSASHTVDVRDVLYVEWVDNRCCVYTSRDVFTIHISLSQLEEVLKEQNFIRISKMTLVDISLSTMFGRELYSTYAHLLSRLVLCSIPVLPLIAFRFINEKYSIWAVLPVHYIICSGLVMLYVFVLGLFAELHPDAYIDMFRSFSMIYALVIIGTLIIDLYQTAKANKNLRAINDKNKG